MAGLPITEAEIQRAREILAANPGMGVPRLGAALGVTRQRAYGIKLKVDGKAGESRAYKTTEVVDPIERIKAENRELQQQLREALERRVLDERYERFVAGVSSKRCDPPEWTVKPKSGKAKQGTPVAHLSDAHFDEVVNPLEIDGANAYDRRIAEKRLRRFFENTIKLTDEYLKGLQYPGIVMPMSGDLFSGNIHDELRETNEDSLCSSLVHWLGPLKSGIRMFAEHYGRIYIPVVVGNHPRLSMKPRAKGAVRDNFDWLLAALLQRDFADDPRITFNIAESFDNHFTIYATRYLQTHGDQFRGGSGIAAELSPMMIGEARKRERQSALNEPFDVMIIGHWHRRVNLPRIKLNGTLKGYDEYAYKMNFRYQDPVQSFWINDPKDGITIEAPIHLLHEDEGWQGKAGKPPAAFEA